MHNYNSVVVPSPLVLPPKQKPTLTSTSTLTSWDTTYNGFLQAKIVPQPNPIKIQYLSDLHLERTTTFPRLKPKAPYLALLGDIGDPEKQNYHEFLEYCSDHFRSTFILMGNHECYGRSRKKASELILNKCLDRDNLFYLNRIVVEIENTLIIGTTLWSHICDKTVPHLNDFHQIHDDRDGRERITRDDYLAWHHNDREFLERVIVGSKHRIVVLTHHLPSFSLVHPRYYGHPYQDAFVTPLDHLIHPPVRAWLCGHSHCKMERWINGVYCGINAGREASLTKVVTLE
jgi:hypothetical protein